MRANLETRHVPRRIHVRRPLGVSELNLVSRPRGIHIYRKCDFQHLLVFLPIYPCVESYSRRWAQTDSLLERALTELLFQFSVDSNRAALDYLESFTTYQILL